MDDLKYLIIQARQNRGSRGSIDPPFFGQFPHFSVFYGLEYPIFKALELIGLEIKYCMYVRPK